MLEYELKKKKYADLTGSDSVLFIYNLRKDLFRMISTVTISCLLKIILNLGCYILVFPGLFKHIYPLSDESSITTTILFTIFLFYTMFVTPLIQYVTFKLFKKNYFLTGDALLDISVLFAQKLNFFFLALGTLLLSLVFFIIPQLLYKSHDYPKSWRYELSFSSALTEITQNCTNVSLDLLDKENLLFFKNIIKVATYFQCFYIIYAFNQQDSKRYKEVFLILFLVRLIIVLIRSM